MAITTGRSPIIMDAQGDDLSTVFQGRDSELPTPGLPKLKLISFRFVADAAGGQCILKSNPGLGGTIIWQSKMIAAGEADESTFEGNMWTNNIYVDTLPAGGRVYVYYA